MHGDIGPAEARRVFLASSVPALVSGTARLTRRSTASRAAIETRFCMLSCGLTIRLRKSPVLDVYRALKMKHCGMQLPIGLILPRRISDTGTVVPLVSVTQIMRDSLDRLVGDLYVW
jgi:hypothetical protein